MNVSACGLICSECQYFEKECPGCYESEGKPFWTAGTPAGICTLFDCSIHKKKYRDCGDCPTLPCTMFVELKDPSISDAEHRENLGKRVATLRARRE